jgi:SnoaL-like domain
VDELRRLAIENECRKLTILYCQYLDHPNPEAFAELYTEDALYKPAVEPVPIQGRAKILEWIRNYPKKRLGRHLATNQIVEVLDENNATGSSYAIVFREPNPQEGVLSARVIPRSVCEYTDTYRRTSAGWRIASRSYEIDFLQEEETRRPVAKRS